MPFPPLHCSKAFEYQAFNMVLLPRWLSGKEATCNAGDSGLISGLGRSPGGRDGKPLQYSCLGTPIDRGAWRTTVHGVAKDFATKQPYGL